jgi:hypothetical protein
MKTNSKIGGYVTRSGAGAVFFLVPFIARLLLLVAMPAAALAVDAVWNANPSSSFWNDDFDWTPASAPEHAGDTATFNTSNVTSLQLSGGVTIDSMTFNAGASAFSIDTSGNSFSFVGHGIANNSGVAQRIVSGNGGTASFLNSSTAANASMTSVDGGTINFFNSSSAGNASLWASGGADCCPWPGYGSGSISFSENSTAGNAGLVAGGGADAGGGSISFSDNSTAGSAALIAYGASFGAGGPGGGGGNISFSGNSMAGNATLTAHAGEVGSSTISFSDNSSAGNAMLSVEGAGGGSTGFAPAVISFSGNSTAGNATLIARDGARSPSGFHAPGGIITFTEQSTGGTASVQVFGNGELDIDHSVTMGSITITSNLSGLIHLDFTGAPSVVRSLVVNGVAQPSGVYGSPTSGAPHQLPQFVGRGTVQVGITVATNAARNLASFSATLNGTVYPIGLTTNVHFQYGTTISYGSTTASHSYTGGTAQAVSANIAGLSPNTPYHFRLVGINNDGTTYGSDTTFTTLAPTGAPVVITNPATDVAIYSATLNGSVDPHGLTSTVYFQYGKTTSYGRTTPSQIETGNTYRNINANINGLSADSLYHFRIVATNSAGTTYGADKLFTVVSNDFNNDNHPDYLLFNPTTRGTVIWYMNKNVHVGGNHGPTLPTDWDVVAVADFNRDGHPDYLLFNPVTHETVIWYMDDNVHVGGNHGPTLPAGWRIGALADLNGDGYPDYLLYNADTGGTVVWYMRNNVRIGSASGPAIPARWILAGVADFSGNGHPDYLLFNLTTHETVIWYMNNNVHVGGKHGPTLPAGWEVAGVADFNRDGHPDYLLFSPTTRGTVIWYMNNNVHVGGNGGPTIPAGWSVVAP